MKNENAVLRNLFISVIFLVSAFISVNAQDKFEGKVKFRMDSPDGNMDMTYFSNGDNVRINVEGEGVEGTMSMILSGKKMMVLMPAQQMYMEFSSDFMNQKHEEEMDDSEQKIKPEDFPKFKTGETKVISGYKCDQYKFTEQDEEVEVWATDELGNFFFIENPMSGEEGVQSMFNGTGFFPLLIISKDKSGGREFKMEATSVEKMSVSSDMFSVPSGYKKFDMGMFNQE